MFTKWRLPIGAFFAGFVWALELATMPVCWPIAQVAHGGSLERGEHVM